MKSLKLCPHIMVLILLNQAFSSTPRALDVSKLVLVGHLGSEPELRMTQHNREYVVYEDIILG